MASWALDQIHKGQCRLLIFTCNKSRSQGLWWYKVVSLPLEKLIHICDESNNAEKCTEIVEQQTLSSRQGYQYFFFFNKMMQSYILYRVQRHSWKRKRWTQVLVERHGVKNISGRKPGNMRENGRIKIHKAFCLHTHVKCYCCMVAVPTYAPPPRNASPVAGMRKAKIK